MSWHLPIGPTEHVLCLILPLLPASTDASAATLVCDAGQGSREHGADLATRSASFVCTCQPASFGGDAGRPAAAEHCYNTPVYIPCVPVLHVAQPDISLKESICFH